MVLFNSNVQILVIVFVNLVYAEMSSKEIKEHAKKSFVSLLKNIIDVNEKRVAAMKRINNLQDFIMTRNTLAKMHNFDMGEDDSSEDFKSQNEILTLLDKRNNLNLTLRRTYKNEKQPANNNINIIIPFNSFNVKSMITTTGNNKLNNINDYNGGHNYNHGKMYGNVNNKIVNINNEDIIKIIDDLQYKSKDENSNENSYESDNDTEMHINDKNSDVKNNKNADINIISDDSDETYKLVDNSYSVNRRSWKSHSCDKSAAKVCRKACVEAHKNGCMLYKCSRRAKKAFSKECRRSCRAMFIKGRYSDSDMEFE